MSGEDNMTDQAKDHHSTAWHLETNTQEKHTFWASIRVALTLRQQRHRRVSEEDNMTKEAKDHHPTAWYSEMSRREKNTFWACTGGWILDAMDVQIFTFAIPAIMASFGVDRPQVGLIATATLLTSAFGGWFAGALSDRYGRVRMLRNTILWFAAFTFLCGFTQNYTEFFVFRAVMGLGFGGEWAAAAVLVGEVINPAHRGKAVGAMQSGWAVGWGIAAAMATLLLSTLP